MRTRRSPIPLAGPRPEAAGRRKSPRSALWEFLGMALVASGLCLAAVRLELRDAVVHMLAATAVELAP
ncbi:hypothetical protein OS965_37495 [Streptomyces sp. H27-G5]|uniref:hypothetical protein n=1 Tax=Streptomyces sp. H27-G5 TaxID=2996698 RepID=UPI00226EA61C|nr:hypothetical protein [Streptomyces sp. H27-G5]MCY0923767.1 hypothetical protein [Streptomyces sp. H27-G5]